jgi:hypothetical protein
MTDTTVDKIARAVLYEGYLLYPYRPCAKNRQRWTFGGLFPETYTATHHTGDASTMQTQCLLEAPPTAELTVTLRFLHLIERTATDNPEAWQEAAEREVRVETLLNHEPLTRHFSVPASQTTEATITRTQKFLTGQIELSARPAGNNPTLLTLRITNQTPILTTLDRDHALLHSLASTHLILHLSAGQFLSLTDPPPHVRTLAAQCVNTGCWPVLAGEPSQTDTLLVSPIILPDYPQVAPESPGDLFDGCEIDEILTLRVLTLTREEKQQAAATDPRIRRLLERTESLARDQLANLHGTIRPTSSYSPGLARGNPSQPTSPPETTPAPANPFPECDPLEPRRSLEKILAANIELRPGDRVRLRPAGNADIFDIALAGKTATIASIEQDYENQIHLAVTIDHDPGRDLGLEGKPGHRFFFRPEEVEPLERETA